MHLRHVPTENRKDDHQQHVQNGSEFSVNPGATYFRCARESGLISIGVQTFNYMHALHMYADIAPLICILLC